MLPLVACLPRALFSAVFQKALMLWFPQDIPIFEGMVANAFPGERGSRGDYLKLVETMRKVVADRPGIQVNAHVIRHAVQLNDIMDMQPGIMLLGAAGCGKTTLRTLVMQAIEEMYKHVRPCHRPFGPCPNVVFPASLTRPRGSSILAVNHGTVTPGQRWCNRCGKLYPSG